jgi:hypothetical protein
VLESINAEASASASIANRHWEAAQTCEPANDNSLASLCEKDATERCRLLTLKMHDNIRSVIGHKV